MSDEMKELKRLLDRLELLSELPLDEPRMERPSRMKLDLEEAMHKSTTWQDLKDHIAPLKWDWVGWLPRGFLTILAAEPGMGKSMLCLWVASCYLAGRDWPDGSPFEEEAFAESGGKVIWCEGESSQGLNLARAEAMALNLKDFVVPLPNPFLSFRMDDENHMMALLFECRKPETRLVVMDSLSSLVPGGPTPSGSPSLMVKGIPRALAQLGEIARITMTPILVTHHLRKRTGLDEGLDERGRISLERIRGTSKIAQAARVVWTLDAPNVHDPEHRRLAVAKNNLMRPPEPLGMRIGPEWLEFGEPPEVAMDNERVSQVELAMDFLVEILGEGAVSVAEIFEAGRAEGLSKMTLRRAKKRLGVRSRRIEEGWEWYLEGASEQGSK